MQGELSELRRDNETFKARLSEAIAEARSKDAIIAQLEAKTEKLVKQNDDQSRLIDNLVSIACLLSYVKLNFVLLRMKGLVVKVRRPVS